MFKTAIVGIDLSPAQAALLSCLPDLAKWGIDHVVLVHVVTVGYGQGAGYGHEQEYRDWLETCAEPLRASGLDVEVAVEDSGSVVQALLQAAADRAADLLVVGSRSHNFLRKVFLGSVARSVITQAELPVLLQRLEPDESGSPDSCAAVCARALDRVLLATDLSAQSSSAEQAALVLAASSGQIDCLYVREPGQSPGQHLDDAEAEQRLQDIVRRIEQAGAPGKVRIEEGRPREVVSRISQQGYTLVVLGKHGHGWVPGALIGSTALEVCESARRPVLMVPVQVD
ncbi:MAG: universal stress protein [Gammaproteobacteria bacterium]|nr:universal stress protein [Gammaproteobacteria bacterium]